MLAPPTVPEVRVRALKVGESVLFKLWLNGLVEGKEATVLYSRVLVEEFQTTRSDCVLSLAGAVRDNPAKVGLEVDRTACPSNDVMLVAPISRVLEVVDIVFPVKV